MVQNVLLPNTLLRKCLWWQPSVVRRRPRRPQAIACLHLASRLALELRSSSVLSFYAGPCGGENAWGTNGNAVGQDGMEFTMNLQYAAGHTGTFEMSFSCTDTSENGLSAVRCGHCRTACLQRRGSALAVRVGGDRGAGAGESCGDIEDHIARRSFAPAAAPAAGWCQADGS